MLSAVTIVLTGLLLGVRHAADPDHVVAVTTIVGRQRSFWRAAGVGALWGLGHTATICLVGGAILLLELTIPPRLGLGFEFAVALMLIGLGLHALLGRGAGRSVSAVRPVVVGMVHGLAGSAAVVLLVLAAIDRPAWSLLYLLVFGLGTVAGMVLVTALIAVPSLYAARRAPTLERWLRLASGALSLGVGLFLAHRIGVVDGLFGAAPQWDPH
jgi:high-affinity nickel-transport protein